MKKLPFIAMILFYSSIAICQSITGNWEGILDVQGTKLPIIFHIKKDSANLLLATFDSPNQKAFNLPCSSVEQKQDSLIISIKMISGKYEGMMSEDRKSLTGKWFQGNGSLPLEMKKTSDVATTKEVKRPQTPKPPFSYFSKDAVYATADKSVELGATFTYPMDKEMKKYPAVLLITGSGKQDRDETIFDHKSFAVIADYLTNHGIAVLRVDDRGTGKSTGNFATSTSADFAQDAMASINYLKTLPNVDTANIGIIGHSEGGMIAPMVAAADNKLRFIVLLAGPAVPVIDLMEQQSADVQKASGIPVADVELYRPLYKNMVTAILQQKDKASAIKHATDVFNYWQNKTPADAVKNTTSVTDEKSKTTFISSFVSQLQQPWMNYFMRFNPADYLRKVSCAVLAINGEKDIQVSPAENLAAIKKAIPKATIKPMPGLNHLFQHCDACTVDEYATLEETFSPEVLQIIGDWVKQQIK